MRIGFAGLGNLGRAIASRLLLQGIDLVVWNRNRETSERFHAPSVSTPGELVAQCDVIFLCLFDSEAVAAVLTGERGVLTGECRGKTIIDLSTNHFEVVLNFHANASSRGAHYLEAPVLGSVIPASQGKLVVAVSGERQQFDSCRQLFDHIGEHIYFLPEPGTATRLKLINNLLLGAFMGAIGEAVVLAEKADIDKNIALEILSVGGGKSGVMTAKKARLQTEDFSPHFAAALIHKDLRYLEELATAVGAESLLAPAARSLYDSMIEAGGAEQDFCAVYDSIRKRLARKE